MKTTIPLLLGVVLLPLAGCGDGGPSLVKVTGTITVNGKPFPGALVEFMPATSNAVSTLGTDTTGPEGNYMVRSASGRTGLAPGKYTVKVSKAPTTVAPTGEEDAPNPKNDPGQQLAESTAAGPRKKASDPLQSATGSFPAEVSAGNNVLDFDVKATASK